MRAMGYSERLFAAIRPERLMETAWELVNIPSPTGETEAATRHYARIFQELGLRVYFDNPLPNAPNMAAYLDGASGGKTLQFDGHMDVVAREVRAPDGSLRREPLPHPEPFVRDGILCGRGAADMKGGLAILAEVARVFAEVGFPFRGRLLFTTHGWHEAPFGFGQDVREMIRAGHVGDAALIAEGADDFIAVAGRGMAIFTLTISREGEVLHENATPPGTPHPLFVAGRVLRQLEGLREELATRTHPLLHPESLFVGQVHGGDFYNRFPNVAVIQGTRRWHPENSFERVQRDLDLLLAELARETNTTLSISWQLVRDSYVVPEEAPIVHAARVAFRQVKGVEPRIGGFASVGDAATLTREGSVPALWFGPHTVGAHGDLESIALEEMVERTQMFLAATVAYFS